MSVPQWRPQVYSLSYVSAVVILLLSSRSFRTSLAKRFLLWKQQQNGNLHTG